MTENKIDTRWMIPMTPAQMISGVQELFYFHRASAHILMAWMARVKETDTKINMGLHGFPDIDVAHQLRSRLRVMNKLKRDTLYFPRGWRTMMETIDAAQKEELMLAAVYGLIKPAMLEMIQHYLKNTDPIGDDPTIVILEAATRSLEKQLAKMADTLKPLLDRPEVQEFLAKLGTLLDQRNSEEKLPEAEMIWPPLDRVPVPVRPDHFTLPQAGKLRTEPVDWANNPQDIAIYLHRAVDDELSTLEFMGRCSYEHPDMPAEFHHDMIRQAYDESRHALLYLRHFPKYNLKYGDLDVSRGAYLLEYEFEGVAPNSRRELLWRVLMRQTFNEGRSLDGLALELKRWEFLQRDDFLHTSDQIYTDEQLHCGSGMKWSLYLCDGDKQRQLEERRLAIEATTRRIHRRRDEFVKNNQDLVEQEAREYINLILNRTQFPFKKPINVEARKRAGQTLEDLQQYLSMEKLPPEHYDIPNLSDYFGPEQT